MIQGRLAMKKPARLKSVARGLAALLSLTLAACTNTNTISGDDHYAFYHPDLVQYVASRGDFPVLIIGSPFGAGSDNDLLAAMQLPGYYPPTPFRTTTAKARDDGHLVLIFNPIRASTGHAACDTPAAQSAANSATPENGATGATTTLRVQAAFCYDRDVVSVAYLEMPRPGGFKDLAFRDAMAQLMAALLPIRGNTQSDCSDPAGVNC
jgi:hypothetical protein